MNNKYFFSIIIPTYNRAHLILNTLISVKNQSFINYELIIVDDGSLDDTRIVVENYIDINKLKNWNYYYITNSERGLARNYGIKKARGEWITFLDSDDIFYPNHLHLASDFISKELRLSVFHSAYEFRNQNNALIRKVIYPKSGDLNQAVLKGNLFSCFGMFLKSDVFNKLKFEEDRELSGSEDWLLWLIVSVRYKIYFQSQISGCMVEHDERSVLNYTNEQLQKRADLLYEKLNMDNVFLLKYGKKNIIKNYAHMLTYGALHLMISGKKKESIFMFMSGFKMNYAELFKKRTLSILIGVIYNNKK